MTLWSRDATSRRKLNNWGSVMSSHQVVVRTTGDTCDSRGRRSRTKARAKKETQQRQCEGNNVTQRAERTGSGKLGIETLAHDTLQTHAGAHEPDDDKREGALPRRVPAVVAHAARMALPQRDGGAHGEEGLDKGAECHPGAGLAAELVTDAADKGAKDEREDRTEGLLIGKVKGIVVLTVEQPCQGQCQLARRSAGEDQRGGTRGGRTCTELPV